MKHSLKNYGEKNMDQGRLRQVILNKEEQELIDEFLET